MDAAIGVTVLLEFQHDPFQCAVLPTGLAEHIQLPGLACLPDDPDAQHPRHSRHSGLDPAVAGQICQRFQREQQVRVFVIAEHLLAHCVKLHPRRKLIPQVLCQQALLRAGGQAVQHEHPLAGVFLLVFLSRQLGRVAAARQGACDGDGIHLVGPLVGGQPVADVGAGGRRFSFISAQGAGHFHGIQSAIVRVFRIVRDDFQRHTGKVHAAQGVQTCGGIHNDLGFHSSDLHFSLPDAAEVVSARSSCCRSHYISFSKTCQPFLRIL